MNKPSASDSTVAMVVCPVWFRTTTRAGAGVLGQGGSARSTGQFRTTVRPLSPVPAGGRAVGDDGGDGEMVRAGGDGDGDREMVRVDGDGEMVPVGGFADGAPDPQAAGATARTAVSRRSGARGIPIGRFGPWVRFRAAPIRGAARHSVVHGWIRLIRVAQLASAVRVPPQLPNGVASYSARVQVCAMYSAATQMFEPSTAVAP